MVFQHVPHLNYVVSVVRSNHRNNNPQNGRLSTLPLANVQLAIYVLGVEYHCDCVTGYEI